MKSFESERFEAMYISGSMLPLLARVHYFRGRQEIHAATRRDVLEALRKATVTQGTKASNRIENIEIDEARYRALTVHNETPLTRSEQAVLGYRDALEFIHLHYARIEITPETILDLHRRIYAKIPGETAGAFRTKRNEITRIEADGTETVVFTPPPPLLVNGLVRGLCVEFARHVASGKYDPFVLLAAFVLDFTCIHPFLDGNGRVSRLLTSLLAYKLGFVFVRYISHEELIWQSKQSYYGALTRSSEHWLRGQHKWGPWLQFLAIVFGQAGEDLEIRIAQSGQEGGFKSARIRDAIDNLPSQFRISDIETALPNASRPTITKVLKDLREAGLIESIGKGPKAAYRKVSSSGPTTSQKFPSQLNIGVNTDDQPSDH